MYIYIHPPVFSKLTSPSMVVSYKDNFIESGITKVPQDQLRESVMAKLEESSRHCTCFLQLCVGSVSAMFRFAMKKSCLNEDILAKQETDLMRRGQDCIISGCLTLKSETS